MLEISASEELLTAIHAAIPEAVIDDRFDADSLQLGEWSSISMSLSYFLLKTKAVFVSLKPFILARPEMEISIRGDLGTTTLKIKNVTPELIEKMGRKVMSDGKRLQVSKPSGAVKSSPREGAHRSNHKPSSTRKSERDG